MNKLTLDAVQFGIDSLKHLSEDINTSNNKLSDKYY